MLKPVTRTFKRTAPQILEVNFDGAGGKPEAVRTTPEHPFHVQGKGFVKASDLRPGDLVTSGGAAAQAELLLAASKDNDVSGFLRVKSLSLEDRAETVYNFEVADTHSYFIGRSQAWVHNACDGGVPPIEPIPIQEGLKRTADIREGMRIGKNRTVAYAEVDTATVKGDVIGISGKAERGGKYKDATIAGNTTRTGPGRLDSEVKIFDHLRAKFKPDSSGTIRLFVDQPEAFGVCQFCTNAIFEFRRDFPNVILKISAN